MKTTIAQLRRYRGMTQSELAEAVGVTRQTIISIESGKCNASLPLAYRISKLFELPIERVFIFDASTDK